MGESESKKQDREVRVKPGVMVGLHSEVSGGVEYDRKRITLEEAGATPAREGEDVRAFQTVARTADPDEYARAKAVRGKAVGKIWAACVPTDFGLVCPDEARAGLDAARAEARAMVAEHERTARHHHVTLRVLIGRLEVETTDELADEIEATADAAVDAARGRDYAGARKAAARANSMAVVLATGIAGRVIEKVRAARAAANEAAAAERAEKRAPAEAEKAAAKAAAAAEKAAAKAAAAAGKAAAKAAAAAEKAAAKAAAAEKASGADAEVVS